MSDAHNHVPLSKVLSLSVSHFQSSGYFEESGFTIVKKTYDLHAEPIWENNIETEHEKMFSEQGIKIKALIAKNN